MKLLIFSILTTIIYIATMAKLVTEVRTLKTAEERREYQSFPLMFASSFLYVVLLVQTTRLALQGVLPLL